MRVLMFGWEFPPFITGGLGTACYGLTRELSKITSRILFVIPRLPAGTPSSDVAAVDSVAELQTDDHSGSGFKSKRGLSLAGAGDVLATEHEQIEFESFLSKIETQVIDSPLQPYLTSGQYERLLSSARQGASKSGKPEVYSEADESSPRSGLFKSKSPEIWISQSEHYGRNLFEEVRRYSALASRFVARERFDVIHAHDWMTFAAGVAAKRASGRPLVVHVHALEFDRSGENVDQRVYDIERYGMENADLVVAVSHRTRQTIITRYGIDPGRVRVLHNGVIDLPSGVAIRKKPVFDEKLVVFLGRVTMQKGPEYFVDAAARVVRVFPRVRFVMAGTGDMLPGMMMRICHHRLNRYFHFTGFVSEAERSELLSRADLFVMTSVSEPFGLTPVEAAQHEVPLIIPIQSGVSEVLNHAIKVDFWDTDRIADAVIQVLNTPRLATQMVQATKFEMERASWGRAAQILRGYYQEVLQT